MNSSFFRLAIFFAGVYILSFAVTAFYLRTNSGGRTPEGIRAPGLVVGAFPAAREFSDAVQIPGTTAVLMVEDETRDRIFSLDAGDTTGALAEIPFPDGFLLKDMEGAAIDPDGYLYVVSSHSLNSEGQPRRGSALARMKMAKDGGLSGPVVALTDLRDRLESQIPEISKVRTLSADEGGLNIEGLAYDAGRRRLLLGLRGPLFGTSAALVPIHLKSKDGAFAWENLELLSPIVLETISNAGIRAISYDSGRDGFWILTGGGGDSKKTKNRFGAWTWTGTDTGPQALDAIVFEKYISAGLEKYKLHPEGICAVRIAGGGRFLLVVTDGSPFYFKMDIPEIYPNAASALAAPAAATMMAAAPSVRMRMPR